jgi:hypothetical protein
MRDNDVATLAPFTASKTGDTGSYLTTPPAIKAETTGDNTGVQVEELSTGQTISIGATFFEWNGPAGYYIGGADEGASPSDLIVTGNTSNSASAKGGSNYVRGGLAQGTTSDGGDLNLYGGPGTSNDGKVNIGGFDNTVSAEEIEVFKGFTIRETANHPVAPVADKGQYWARSSDGKPMFTSASNATPAEEDYDLSSGGGGSAITVTDEGDPLTTDVVSFDFVGDGVTAETVGDDVTVTIGGGAAPIDTVFSRTGTVIALASDYDASLVDNDSTVAGAFVDDALNTLKTAGDLNTTHAGSDGTDHSDVGLNNTHRGSDGTDHSDVVANTAATALNTTHRSSDGTDHSDVVANAAAAALNTTHRGSDGSDHADVVANTAKVTNATHTGDVSGATTLSIGALKVGTANIQDNAVTYDKMQSGTAGALIVYSGSGNPVDIGVGTVTHVLTSNGSGTPSWEIGAASAHLLGSATHTADTLANFNTKISDTNVTVGGTYIQATDPVASAVDGDVWIEIP